METCVDTLMTAMKLSIGAFIIVLTIALIIITMITMIVMNLLIIMIIPVRSQSLELFPNYAKLHLWIRKVFAAQLLLNSDPFERELHRRQSTIVLWS